MPHTHTHFERSLAEQLLEEDVPLAPQDSGGTGEGLLADPVILSGDPSGLPTGPTTFQEQPAEPVNLGPAPSGLQTGPTQFQGSQPPPSNTELAARQNLARRQASRPVRAGRSGRIISTKRKESIWDYSLQ